MTFKTDTFDLIFQDKQDTEAEIDSLQASIDFYQSRVDALESRRFSVRRSNQIATYNDLIADAQADLADASDEITGFNAVLPQDEFNLEFSSTTDNRGRSWVQTSFEVSDSPYDDTFESGDGLKIQFSGSWRQPKYRRGRLRGYANRSRTITHGVANVGPDDSSIEYMVSSPAVARLFAKAEDVDVSIINNNGDVLFSDTFSSADVAPLA